MRDLSNILIGFGLTISSFSLIMTTENASAQQGGDRFSNDDYILQEGSLNYGSEDEQNNTSESESQQIEDAPDDTSGQNYNVRSGSEYYYSMIPFEFSISSQFIDFGPLVPGSPVTRTNSLKLSNGSVFGYQVLTYENHPLRIDSEGNDVPDTTCDSGTCSEITSDEWAQNTTYGLGYRCNNISGSECASGFSSSTHYKQFSNLEQNESPQAVMVGNSYGEDFESEIEYKVNISSTQGSGLYKNQIVYIAVPSI